MRTDETNPNDWFLLGRERLQTAVGADYDLLRVEAAKMVSLILSVGAPPSPPRPCS